MTWVAIYNRQKAEYLTFLVIAFISFIAFYPGEFTVGHDLASYLAIAKNFVVGQGMTDLQGDLANHRFGYKLILAASIWLGQFIDNELLMVSYVQMLLCCLSACLFYVFTRILFDRYIAVLAFAFFILCPTIPGSLINYGLDGVWPAFTLASLIAFILAGRHNCKTTSFPYMVYVYLLISAVFAGMSVWIKETTGLNALIIPFLIWFFRCSYLGWRHIISFYAFSSMMLILGLFVLSTLGGGLGEDSNNEQRTLSSALYFALNYYGDFEPISLLLFLLNGLRGYFFFASFSQNIHIFYPVFFMFYGGIVYAFYQSFRYKDRSCRILLICLMAYLPYMAYAAQWYMRYVQLVFILMIVSIYIALFTKAVFDFLVTESENHNVSKRRGVKILACILILGLLSYQYSSSKYKPFYLDDNPFLNHTISIFKGKRPQKFKGIDQAETILSYAETSKPVQLFTESIPFASGLVFAEPENFKTNVGLYHRMILGVHENPYTPYVWKKHFDDIAFLCLRNNIKERGKRYGELLAFIPSAFIDYVRSHNGESFVYLMGGHDCTALLQNWISHFSHLYGLTFTPLIQIEGGTFVRLYRVELDGNYKNHERSLELLKSKALDNYLARLQHSDLFAAQYYKERYPFLYAD